MISYAKARADVLLHRALHRVAYVEGFYIDVGAHDPVRGNITKHFYDHGWQGVNVEPTRELFPAFVEGRPRDINLQVAVTEQPGTVTFYDIEGRAGSAEGRSAQLIREAEPGPRSYTVPAVTLAQICEEHAPAEIHLLKMNLMDREAAAIRGLNLKRFRPWIVVIEAAEMDETAPPNYQECDGVVCGAGYRMVYSDHINRYYLANEHGDLSQYFVMPVDNYMDGSLLEEIDELKRRIDGLEADLRDVALARN